MVAWLMKLVMLAQNKQVLDEVWPHIKTIGEEIARVLVVLGPTSFSLKAHHGPASTTANEIFQRLKVQGIPEDELKHVLAACEAADEHIV